MTQAYYGRKKATRGNKTPTCRSGLTRHVVPRTVVGPQTTFRQALDHLGQEIRRQQRPLRIVSIDPGVRNYCLRVEDRVRDRSCLDRVGSDLLGIQILETLFLDLDPEQTYSRSNQETMLYTTLTMELNAIRPLLIDADLVLIEQQMVENTNAMRIMQHTICWFMNLFSGVLNGEIYEMSPKLKTRINGCPGGLTKTAYKNWTKGYIDILLQHRGDQEALAELRHSRKSDDLADTVAMSEAFCQTQGLLTTEDIYGELSEKGFEIGVLSKKQLTALVATFRGVGA